MCLVCLQRVPTALKAPLSAHSPGGTAATGGRGGYCPPLIRNSLGFGTHERGSRRLSPHP
eukprot:1528207-Prymnesium_polylepis.1